VPESFTAQRFLEVARELAAIPTAEAKLRAAVSRAYYAIFLMVRDKANIIGKNSVHERAKTAVAAKSSAAGGTFQTLRELRTHADYVLKAGDLGYDPAYDDWEDNWKNTEWCCTSLLAFLAQWQ
jgi:hypothetical protein